MSIYTNKQIAIPFIAASNPSRLGVRVDLVYDVLVDGRLAQEVYGPSQREGNKQS